ncbi:MAG: pirin family protein [Deltaproteobacteria bacterium]|nr:pirin family protein [Deltaproteobacteria bacterium]
MKTSTPTSIEIIFDAAAHDLGGFTVRRALPTAARRMVGPFTFFDHMGPGVFAPGHGIDVRPHPHIGLATVTYLFDGEIFHRDSLGSAQAIRPGDINWMNAGRGIVHSERTSATVRERGSNISGLQLWVALPTAHEESEPTFAHHPAATLPQTQRDGVAIKLLAGSAYGLTSPVATLSPLFYVDVHMSEGSRLPLPAEHEERALYVIDGAVDCDGLRVEPGKLVVFSKDAQLDLRALSPTRLVQIGGAPLDGKRTIFWNFVSSSKARIDQAAEDWKAGRFPKVPGDEIEFIPLPA